MVALAQLLCKLPSIHSLANLAPIKDALGNITGVVSNFIDITELVELQELQEEMSHLVAHDIRQPLTAIRAHSQLLQMALRTERIEQAFKSAEAVVTSTQRMNTMIDDMVDSVRVQAGRLELKYQTVELAHLLADVLERSRMLSGSDRLRLCVEKDLPRLQVDVERLERVILNLVSNAYKYSEPDQAVEVRAARRDNEVVVSVADQGQGIAPEDVPHIFERFYKTKGTRRQESVGLGLYITRMLIEAHHGRIWVESELSKGTAFHFTLPIPEEQ
ncbi:MAG TPA: HAMP domain-containing sensor histidine kinase [Chloroflexota bacterium]|nr:HAMP domain-containing sensor histidine kinase [Chloroflexota bacterium]